MIVDVLGYLSSYCEIYAPLHRTYGHQSVGGSR